MLNRKVSRVSRLKVGAMLAVAVMGITGLTTNIIRPVNAAQDQLNSNATPDLGVDANWSLGVAPTLTNSDGVLFNSAFSGLDTTNTFLFTTVQSWNGMTFGSGYGTGITLNSTGAFFVALGTTGIDMTLSPLNFTMGASMLLAGSQTWNSGTAILAVTGSINAATAGTVLGIKGNTSNVIITGNISGSGAALQKDDAGTLTLAPVSNGIGSVTLNAGLLNLNSGAAAGGKFFLNGGTFDATNPATVSSNGLSIVSGSLSLSTNPAITIGTSLVDFKGTHSLDLGTGAVTLNNSATVNVPAGVELLIRGIISGGANTLTKTGTGTLQLGAVNNVLGGIVLSEGALLVGSNGGNPYGSSFVTTNNVYLAQFTASGSVTGNQQQGSGVSNYILNGTLNIANLGTGLNGGTNGFNISRGGTVSGSATIIMTNPNNFYLAIAGSNFSNFLLGAGSLVLQPSASGNLTNFPAQPDDVLNENAHVFVAGANFVLGSGDFAGGSNQFGVESGPMTQTLSTILTLLPGNANFQISKGTSALSRNSLFLNGGIDRREGGTANLPNWTGTQNGTLTISNATTFIAGAGVTVANNNWAAVAGDNISIIPMTTYDNALSAGLNALISATHSSMTFADTSVNSIKFDASTSNATATNMSVIATAGTYTITSGGILFANAANGTNSVFTASITGAGKITAGAGNELFVFQNNGSALMTIGTEITGNIAVTKVGGGTLVLTHSNSFTGNLWLNGGLTVVDNLNELGTGSTLGLNGGVLYTSAGGTLSKNIILGGEGAHAANNISGGQGIAVAPGQALTLTGTLSNASTAYNAGAFSLAGGGTFNIPDINKVNLAIDTLQLQDITLNATNPTATNVVLAGNTLRAGLGLTTLNLNPGSGSITLAFSTLDSNNSIAGAVRWNNFDANKTILTARDVGSAAGPVGGGGGSWLTLGMTDFAGLDASHSRVSGPLASVAGTAQGYSNFDLAGTNIIYNSTVSLPAINLNGSGTLSLNFNNGGNGTYTVGAIRVDNPSGVATAGALTQTILLGTPAGKTTLTLGGFMMTPNVGPNVVTIAGPLTTGDDLIRGGGSLDLWQNDAAGTLVITAHIGPGGNTNLVKLGPGLVIFNSSKNDFAQVTVLEGTIENDLNALGGGTINLNGGNFLQNGTGSKGTIFVGDLGGTLTVSAGATMSSGGAINNLSLGNNGVAIIPGTFTKSGAGSLILSGNGSFSGVTQVSQGALIFTGAQGVLGNVVVGSGGTLGGTAKLPGTVNLTSGGILSPAVSPFQAGTITLGNALFGSNSSVNMDLHLTAGADAIVLSTASTFTVTGNVGFNLFQTAGGGSAFNNNGDYTLITGFSAGSILGLSLSGGLITNFNAVNVQTPAHYTFKEVDVGGIGSIVLTVQSEKVVGLWAGKNAAQLDWQTKANWGALGLTDQVPGHVSGDSASFGSSGNSLAGAVALDNSAVHLANLILANDSNGGGYTIVSGTTGTNTLFIENGTFSTGITVNSGTHTISAGIELDSNTNITAVDTASKLILGGVLSKGTGTSSTTSLTMGGLGTVVMGTNATWTGNATISGGVTLQYGNGGATGQFGAGANIFLNNATLSINRSDVSLLSSFFPNNQTGAIQGTGVVLQAGSNNIAIDGSLPGFTGTLGVTNGTLSQAVASKTFGLFVGAAGTFDMTGITSTFNSLSGSGVITNSVGSPAIFDLRSAANSTFSGIIQYAPGNDVELDVSSATTGTLTLNGGGGTNNSPYRLVLRRNAQTSNTSAFLVVLSSNALNPASVIEIQEEHSVGSNNPSIALGNGVNLANNIDFTNIGTTSSNWRYNAEGIGLVPANGTNAVSATLSGILYTDVNQAGDAPILNRDPNSGFRIGTGVNSNLTNNTLTIAGGISTTGSSYDPIFFMQYGGNMIFNNATVNAGASYIYLGILNTSKSANFSFNGFTTISTSGIPSTFLAGDVGDAIFFGVTSGGVGNLPFPGNQSSTSYTYTIGQNTLIDAGIGFINLNGGNAAGNVATMNFFGTMRAGGWDGYLNGTNPTGTMVIHVNGGTFAASQSGTFANDTGTKLLVGTGSVNFDISVGSINMRQPILSDVTNGVDGGINVNGGTTGFGVLTMSSSANTYSGLTRLNDGGLSNGITNGLPVTTTVILTNSSNSKWLLNGLSQTLVGFDAVGTSSTIANANTITVTPLAGTTHTFAGQFGNNNDGPISSVAIHGVGTQNIVGGITLSGGGSIGLLGGTLVFGNASMPSVTTLNGVFAVGAGESTFNLVKGNDTSAWITNNPSFAARTGGGTANFVVSNGVNGNTVGISTNLQNQGGFIDQGVFFNGADFAWADNGSTGYLRAPIYGTDANTLVATSASVFAADTGSHYSLGTAVTLTGDLANILTLKIGTGGSLGLGGNTMTLNDSGLLKSGGDSSTISGGLIKFASGQNASPVIRVDGTSTLTLAASILDNTNLKASGAKSGTGTLILNASGNYAGQLFVNAGTVSLFNPLALSKAVVVLPDVGLGVNSTYSTLAFGNNISNATIAGLVSSQGNTSNLSLVNDIGGGVALTINDDGLTTSRMDFWGSISGPGSLIVNASNSLFVLHAASLFSGGSTIRGTVVLGTPGLVNGQTESGLGTGLINIDGGTLVLRNSSDNTTPAAIILNNNINVTAAGATLDTLGLANNGATLNGNLTGTGLLRQVKTNFSQFGQLYFNGDNRAFAGTFENDAANVTFANVNAMGTSSTYNFLFTNGTNGGVTQTFINTANGGTVTVGAIYGNTGNTFTFTNASAGFYTTLVVGGNNSSGTLGGALTSSGTNSQGLSLTKIGTGTLTLAGSNAIDAINNSNNSDTSLNTFATRIMGGTVIAANPNAFSGTQTSSVGLGVGFSSPTNTNLSLLLNGVTILNNITVINNLNAGTYLLGGIAASNSQFSGTVAFNRSTTILQADTNATLTFAGVLTGPATSTITIGSATANGTVVFQNLSVNPNLLSPVNVVNGKLFVNGSFGSGIGNLTMSPGTTLGGTGSISGSLTLTGGTAYTGAHLAPGNPNAVGTLTVRTNSTFSAGSVIDLDFTDPGSPNGGSNDTFNLLGLTVGSTGSLGVNLVIAGSANPYGVNGNYTIGFLTSLSGVGGIGAFKAINLGGTTVATFALNGTTVNMTITGGIPFSSWNVNASGTWSNNTNWTSVNPNGNGAIADMASVIGTSSTTTVFMDGSKTLTTLKFSNTQGKYDIVGVGAGTALNFTASVLSGAQLVLASADTQNSISAPVILGSNLTVNAFAAGSLLTINGSVSGAGGLTVIGNTGSLVLAGSQVVLGGSVLNTGNLVINGSLSTPTITNTRVMTTLGNVTLSGAMTNSGTFTLAAIAAPTVLGGINNTGTLVVGSNLTGGTTGTLGSVVVVNTGTIQFNHSDSFAVSTNAITNTGTIVNAGGTQNLMTITGASSLTGTLTAAAGTIRLGDSTIVNDNSIINMNGGALDLNGQTFNGGGNLWRPVGVVQTTGSGKVGNSTGTEQIGLGTNGNGTANQTYAFSFVDMGAVINVTKTSNNTTTLSAFQNFTNGTTTLLVQNSPVAGDLTLNGTNGTASSFLGSKIVLLSTGGSTLDGIISLGANVILGSDLELGNDSPAFGPSNSGAFDGEPFRQNAGAGTFATFAGNINFVGTPNPGAQYRFGNSGNGTLVYAGTSNVPASVPVIIDRGSVTLGGSGVIISNSTAPAMLGGAEANLNSTLLFTMSDNAFMQTMIAGGTIGLTMGITGLTSGQHTLTVSGNSTLEIGTNGDANIDILHSNQSGAATNPGANSLGTTNLNITGNGKVIVGQLVRGAPTFVAGSLANAVYYPGTIVTLSQHGSIVAGGTSGTDLLPSSLTDATAIRADGGGIDLNHKEVVISHQITSVAAGTSLASYYSDSGLTYTSTGGPGTVTLQGNGAIPTYKGPTTLGSNVLFPLTANAQLGDEGAGGAIVFDGGTLKLTGDISLDNSTHNASTSLVHRYTFNDGTANDSAPANHSPYSQAGTANGTLHGAATIGSGVLTVPGTAQGGADTVTLPASGADNVSAININTYKAATIVAWVTPAVNPATGYSSVFDFGGAAGNNSKDTYFDAQYRNNGQIAGQVNAAGDTTGSTAYNGETNTGSATATVGSENQVVVMIDGGNLTYYLNGQIVQTSLLRVDYGGQTLAQILNNVAMIGGAPEGQNEFNGSIDEFRIYNQALSPQDIVAINNPDNTPNSDLSATTLVSRNMSIASGGATMNTNGFTGTISGNIAQASGSNGVMFLNGGGSVVLTGSSSGNLNNAAGNVLRVGVGDTQGFLTGGNVVNNGSLIINRTGAATFGANISGTGPMSHTNTGTTVLAGRYTAIGNVSVSAGGRLAFAGNQTNAIQTPSLAVAGPVNAPTSTVDLTHNKMIIQGTPTLGVWDTTNQVYTGALGLTASGTGLSPLGGGLPDWSGKGITTSAATSDTGLAIADGAYYKNALSSVNPDTSVFGGVAVNDSDTLIKYTWNGDTNLDGTIDFWDYIQIDSGVQDQFNPGFVMNYSNGDFNLDGQIDFWDYIMIDSAAQDQNSILDSAFGPLGSVAAGDSAGSLPAPALSLGGGGASAVPEPASLALLGIGAAGLLLRRRKTKN